MGRKDLLKDLMAASEPPEAPGASQVAPAAEPAAEPPAAQGRRAAAPRQPRYAKGAIGAVGQTIADLKSRALTELDATLIDAGGMVDRLDHDEDGHQALMASIRDYGQQVPVLVRPHPEAQGRYQIVYGRRRVLALRDLDLPVKAMIRDLDDSELVIAQGQENAARRDLSFIEKANFARQLRDAGYERKIICDALHIDKTTVSRMLSVADRTPTVVIETIGAATGIGRDRWLRLADLLEAADWDPNAAAAVAEAPANGPSEARFESLMNALLRRSGAAAKSKKTRAEAQQATGPEAKAGGVLKGADGRPLGRIRRAGAAITLTFEPPEKAAKGAPETEAGDAVGFAEWLADHIAEIHRGWRDGRGE